MPYVSDNRIIHPVEEIIHDVLKRNNSSETGLTFCKRKPKISFKDRWIFNCISSWFKKNRKKIYAI